MMTSGNLTEAVIPKGTTTVIMDPHEIGNAWGIEGVRYIHEASQDLPMCQLIDIPSCASVVPGLEYAGTEFGSEAIEELAKLECVVGPAEVMDYLDVIHGDDCMMDIIRTAEDRGLYLQGHAPSVEGRMLSAYLCRGPNTCYESRTAEEVVEKTRSGMRVDAREADDILHNGHINDVVRAAIRYCMGSVVAIKSITLNSAGEAGLQNLGAIVPGYAADMLLVDDLRELTPSHVFYGGKLVALYHLPARIPGKVKVNLMKYYDMNLSTTDTVCEEVCVKGGRIDISGDGDLRLVAAVSRYRGDENIALGLVQVITKRVVPLLAQLCKEQ